jgi:pyruvate/2-oxoglutarate dehydrogenase complex dihydrolipoamide dehydrogenase (E3) component
MKSINFKIKKLNSTQTDKNLSKHIGIDLFIASPKFVENNRIKLNDHHSIRFQRACIATKDKFRIPNEINSLKRSEYLLPEDIFNLRELPADLLVLGSDCVGLEIA